MKTISGKVTCSQAKEIPAGAVAVVVVNDNSLMDAPSKTLGKVEIKDPKTFPIEFKVEFDEQPVLNMAYGIFAIQVFINLGERLIFCTDTQFSIVDDDSRKIKDNLDVFVIKVARFDNDGNQIQDD